MATLAPAALGIALALLVAALPGRGAHAHAVLLESSPPADAVLAEAPRQIVLRFNEPIRPVVVRLLIADGAESIELGRLEAVDTELRATPPAGLRDGSYVLSYRVTSADGHPVVGSFMFTVGARGASGSPGLTQPGQHDRLWVAVGIAARALCYGTLLLAAGLAFFLAWLPVPADLRPPLRRGLAWLSWSGLAACLALLGATGGALSGGPAGTLLTSAPWRLALASPVAATIAAAAPGLGILALVAGGTTRHERLWLLSGGGLAALSFALSGHAATAGPPWITVPALTLHALCAACWVGAFAPLLLALRRLPRHEAHALLAAFSSSAVAAVAGLVLAGVVLAALQLRTPSALIATDYGRLLLLKIALVVLLLGLGAVNRLVLTPALARRADAVPKLRATIGADLVLAAGVVVLTAGLGAVPPPRALAEQAAAHAHAGHGAHDYAVQAAVRGHNLVLVATPAAVGENRIDLYLTDGRGQPVVAMAAEMTWALPDVGVEALRVDARAIEPGHFQGRTHLPLAGEWQVHADLLIDDFTKLPFRARIVLGQ